MLCDTAHVLMLFHGALHAGDWQRQRLVPACGDPPACLQYSAAVSVQSSVWRTGHCLDTADRGSVYGCDIVSDLFPDPETGRLAGHNLEIDFTGVIPVFSL